MKVFAIAIGGAGGALARYAVGLVVASPERGIPWPTFIVNMSGSFIAGTLAALFVARSSSDVLSAGLVIGFLGAYTTFSAFAVQTEGLLAAGTGSTALFYVLLSIVIGICAAWAGVRVGRAIA